MKSKEIILIALTILLSIILSVLLYQYLVDLFRGYGINTETDSQTHNQLESSVHYSLFIQCFTLLIALISLPVLLTVFKQKLKIHRENLGKTILILEAVGLLIAYLTTPPDYISTVISFMVWQLPVIVNFIVLFITLKK